MNEPVKILPQQIETERLILRPYQAGDGAMLYAAGQRNRDHLTEFESENLILHLKDAEHAEAVIQDLAEDWTAGRCYFIGIFERGSGAWAGQVYVAPTNADLPEYVIGFAADKEFEGRGYISEAVHGVLGALFNEVGAHRVKSDCHEDNVRSWRLMERCGFTREGHLRENKRNPDGSFHGDYLYGLLREEFDQR